ncbi:MAG: 50S ribosomal protein L20 [Patescibacteria group bacterium]
MTRVKKGVHALKRRKNVLARVKGYRFGRSTKERQAKEAINHAGTYAFAHRRDKKNDNRMLWNVKIGATVKEFNLSYSTFIGVLKKKNILINRKMLAYLAQSEPETFKRLVKTVL